MSDIKRNTSLVKMDSELQKKHREIQVNEKKSQINALKQRLDDLESIEAKKLRLQVEILQKEIDFLISDKIIDMDEE